MNQKIISAGGMIVRFKNNALETVIVGNGVPSIWRIPKGMQEIGERIEETAVREVREETGYQTTPIQFIDSGSWTYEYDGRYWDETCHFFVLKLESGNSMLRDNEFEQLQWVYIEKASDFLYYEIEKDVARRTSEILMNKNSTAYKILKQNSNNLL